VPAAPLAGDRWVVSISSPAMPPSRHRQAEIEDLDAPVGADHDVRALEVAVDHAPVVSVRHGGHNLAREVEGGRHRHRTAAADHLRKGYAFDVLHDQEWLLTEIVHAVDGADRRMIE